MIRSSSRKVFADCPDTIYHQFNVRPDGTYEIQGTRGAFAGFPGRIALGRIKRGEVKNGQPLEFELPHGIREIVATYRDRYRPRLLKAPCCWLFARRDGRGAELGMGPRETFLLARARHDQQAARAEHARRKV